MKKLNNILNTGYDKHFQAFKNSFAEAKKEISKIEVTRNSHFKNDLIGFVPIVPSVIKGIPQNMINFDTSKKKIPTCKIMIETSEPAGTRTDDAIKYKAVVFALIELLEQKGIRCEVWAQETSIEEDECFHYQVKIKDYFQPLNIYKLQFPVISPDMLRRIGFRLLETENRLHNSFWTFSYGHPAINDNYLGFKYHSRKKLPSEAMKKILDINDDDLYIPNTHTLNIDTVTEITEIIQRLYNYTGLNKYVKL